MKYFLCFVTFSAALGLRPEAGSDDQHFSNSTKMKVISWNMGGGSPSPEFLGDWSSDEKFKKLAETEQIVAGVLWSMAELGGKRAHDYFDESGHYVAPTFSHRLARQFQPLMDWSQFTGKPGSQLASVTVGDFLGEEFAQAALARARLAGYGAQVDFDFDPWLRSQLDELLTSQVAEAAKKDSKTWARPEGCFKNRKTLPVFADNFMGLVGKLHSGEMLQFWDSYLEGLEVGTENTKKFCDAAARHTKTMDFMYAGDGEMGSEEGNFVRVTVLDAIALKITAMTLDQSQLHENTFKGKSESEADAILLATLQAAMSTDANAILLLQEVNAPWARRSADPSHSIAGTDDASVVYPTVKFSEIVTKDNRKISDLFDDYLKSINEEILSTDRKTNFQKNGQQNTPLPLAIRNKHVVVMLKAQDDPTQVTIALSIHAAANNCHLYLEAVSRMVENIFDKLDSDTGTVNIVVGMDSNVKGKSTGEDQTVKMLLDKARSVGLTFDDNAREQATVRKERTHLQAQFTKAGVRDELAKDWVFAGSWARGEEKPRQLEVSSAVRNPGPEESNTPKLMYPTNEWPADHFMVTADVTLVG